MDIELAGLKITEVRPMTEAEMKKEYWDDDNFRRRPTVLVLENGTRLYASRDTEGNGPGAIFGAMKDGKQFGLG